MGPEFESNSDAPRLPSDLIGGDNDTIDVGGDDDRFEIEFADDAGAPNPYEKLTAQNEDLGEDEDHVRGASDEDLGDETSSRVHEEVQRERQLRADAERRWLADQEATEKRLVETQKESLKAQTDSFKLALDGIDVRIQTAQDGLKYARSESDYSAEVDLQAQLDQLKDMRRNIEGNLQSLPKPEDIDTQYEKHVQTRRAEIEKRDASSSVRGLNEKANKWIEKNSWFHDPQHAAVKKTVLEINAQLASENLDPKSDEFFAELNRRLARRHSNIKVSDIGGSETRKRSSAPPVASRRTASPASSRGNDNGAQRGRKPTVKFEASDRAILKSLGIDPSNKAAVQRYAAEKYSRESRERANRQGR